MMIDPDCRFLASQALATQPGVGRIVRGAAVSSSSPEIPFQSQWADDHDWSCDDCDHAFVTSIRLWRR